MTRLGLDHLSKGFTTREGTFPALRGVSMAVDSGELLALLGPSGCGKTTTLRLVAGLLDPTDGDITFDGASVLRVPAEKRRAVLVFQSHSLFPFFSVWENVAFGLKMHRVRGGELRRRVAEALDLVRLTGLDERWADELSGGQRQRVALARALAVRPRVLLLDEPLGSLDPELREELREEITGLQKQLGITTVFVTHDQAEAVAVADRVALMMAGRVVQTGPPRDFYERPAEARVARFFGAANIFPARKRRDTIETDWGTLAVAPSALPDGPVLATIRPEAIYFAEAIVFGQNGGNTLSARVVSWTYRGETARCSARVGDLNLEISAAPYPARQPGENLSLHFPRERIWLMPAESDEA